MRNNFNFEIVYSVYFVNFFDLVSRKNIPFTGGNKSRGMVKGQKEELGSPISTLDNPLLTILLHTAITII